MAISIDGVVYKVSADTSEFAKAMKRVEDLQLKQAKLTEKYDNDKINSLARISLAEEKLETLREEYAGIQNASSEEEIRRRKEIEKQIKSQEKAIESLKDKQKLADAVFAENSKKTQAEIETLSKKTTGLKGAFGKLSSGMSSTLGKLVGGLGVAGMVAHFDKVATKLDALAKRARDVGMTASQLQEFEHQAKLAGVETSGLDSAVKTFGKNISLAAMGTGEAKTALADMGISLKDANGMTKTQDELLKEVALKFADNAGAAENAGRATKIFGDNGAEMLRIFEQGGDAVNKIFNAKGIDEAAEAAERYKDKLEKLSNYSFKISSKVVEGWSLMADAIFGDGIAEEEYKQQEKAWNEQIKKRQKAQEEAQKAEEARIAKAQEAMAKADEELRKSEEAELSARDKVLNLKLQEERLAKQLLDLDETSDEYAKLYAERIKTVIELRKQEKTLEAEILREKEKQSAAEKKKQEKAEAERKKEQDKYNAEQEALFEENKRIANLQKEYQENLRLEILKKQGNERLVKRIEFERRVAELMEQQGYSQEKAYKFAKLELQLREKQNADGKKVKYADEDVKRAKRIVEKGLGGKKTQEQAKAILAGEKYKGDEMASFQGARSRAKREKGGTFAPTANELFNDAKSIKGGIEQTAVGGKKQQTENGGGIAGKLDEILQAVNKVPDTLTNLFSGE